MKRVIIVCVLVLGVAGLSYSQDSIRTGDWIKFKVSLGGMINGSSTGMPFPDKFNGYKGGYTEYKEGDRDYYPGLLFGGDFILGKNKWIKHELSINGVITKSKYSVYTYFSPYNGTPGSSICQVYDNSLLYLNINNGLMVRIVKGLYFETGICSNLVAYMRSKQQITETHGTNVPDPNNPNLYYVVNTSDTYNKTESSGGGGQWSYQLKLLYDLDLKNVAVGLFASENFGADKSLQWFTVGISVYPFKKLR